MKLYWVLIIVVVIVIAMLLLTRKSIQCTILSGEDEGKTTIKKVWYWQTCGSPGFKNEINPLGKDIR